MSAPSPSAGSSRLGAVVLVVGALLIAALLLSWFLLTFERVTRTVTLPPRGEAAYNPLYALKRALEVDDRRVNARAQLQLERHPLRPEDTLLMLFDPRLLSPRDRDRLLAWVERGGHLILSTPSPDADLGASPVPILTDLGVVASEDLPRCMRFKVEGFPEHREFCQGRRFGLTDEGPQYDFAWDDETSDDYGYVRLRYGQGSVDVIADLDFVRNRSLEDGPHAALARQLLAPNYDAGGTFHLIYSTEMPSFLALLWKHGWMLIVPLALAVALWLWLRAGRFGPLRPSPPLDRRSLLEHIQASGDHLYRYGRTGTLYAEVHAAFLSRLRRRDPYAAALEGPARIEALARRTGLSAAEVEAALRYPRPRDRRDFVLRISKLLHLRSRL